MPGAFLCGDRQHKQPEYRRSIDEEEARQGQRIMCEIDEGRQPVPLSCGDVHRAQADTHTAAAEAGADSAWSPASLTRGNVVLARRVMVFASTSCVVI